MTAMRSSRAPSQTLGLLLAAFALAASPSHIRPAAAVADPAGDLQARITAAIARSAPSLAVPAGIYSFGNRTLLI
eukprot:SAG11_NODE_13034_length_673_cov_1.078397_1_plen_74_part_10